MNSKSMIWLGMVVGTSIGGFLSVIWGGSVFSFSSVVLTAVFGFLGIYIGYKISQ